MRREHTPLAPHPLTATPSPAVRSFSCPQAAARTNDTAGDGTTTATVLSAAFIAEGMKIVSAGTNPVQVGWGGKRGPEELGRRTVGGIEEEGGRGWRRRCRMAGIAVGMAGRGLGRVAEGYGRRRKETGAVEGGEVAVRWGTRFRGMCLPGGDSWRQSRLGCTAAVSHLHRPALMPPGHLSAALLPPQLVRGMEKTVQELVKELRKMSSVVRILCLCG